MIKRNRLMLFSVMFLFLIISTCVAINSYNRPAQVQVNNNNTGNNQSEYVLQEYNMFCPFCGSSVIAVNYNIVCRNIECEMYGLPVCVSKCVNDMDNYNEDSAIGK